MAENTPIHWCDSTVNPTMGCDGCELWHGERKSCYAGILHDMRGKTNPGYATDFNHVERFPGRMTKAARLSDLAGLRRRRKTWLDGQPRMIFISDMGDSLSASVSFEYLEAEIIDAVVSPAGRRHQWLWLTKRPKRMADFSAWLADWDQGWPENLWAGTSVTTSKTVERIDDLLKVGDERTMRFLSIEPQLENVDLRGHLAGIAWVIQGGESGGDPRPFDMAWARDLRDQCRQAGVDYFCKQLGSKPLVDDKPLCLEDRHGADWDEWPEDLRVREVPSPTGPEDGVCPVGSNAAEVAPAIGTESVRRSVMLEARMNSVKEGGAK